MIEQKKKSFREQILEICKRNSIETLTIASKQIIKCIADLVENQKPKTVFCYFSYRKEIQTRALLSLLEQKEIRVCIPRICGDQMKAVRWTSKTRMIKNQWGIEEPERGENIDDVDLAILPGVAFGRDGTRLGYGGGFYDRWLSEHLCYKLGICGSWQLLDEIPVEEHDIKVDAVFREKEQIFFTRNSIYNKIKRR